MPLMSLSCSTCVLWFDHISKPMNVRFSCKSSVFFPICFHVVTNSFCATCASYIFGWKNSHFSKIRVFNERHTAGKKRSECLNSSMRIVTILSLLSLLDTSFAFQNFFTSFSSARSPIQKSGAASIEDELLKAIADLGENRLANDARISSLVTTLERTKSISNPAIAQEVYGRWKLVHTNNANTASPIQRKAVDSSSFAIFQDITFNDKSQLVVSQVVKFSENAELKVDALASTSAYPLPELTERKGDGKILGFNVLGVSVVGEEAQEDESRPDSRIKFVFDEGNFEIGSFKIPYPVPFRLPILRDAVKGWIDITYMSERMRISRGNKGTTFILVKEGGS